MYWVIGILGLAYIISPFYFNYTDSAPALWVSLIIGAGVLILAVLELLSKGKDRWEYIVAEILGITAIFAPFIFGFKDIEMALGMGVGVGLLLALFSASKLTIIDNIY